MTIFTVRICEDRAYGRVVDILVQGNTARFDPHVPPLCKYNAIRYTLRCPTYSVLSDVDVQASRTVIGIRWLARDGSIRT